jgi:tripartite-type tricarboxylate transporter receptor subunit TctC
MFLHSTKKTALTAIASLLLLGGAFQQAVAQDKYPSRPIEVIVTFGPGGGADAMARQLTRLLERDLGTAMPVVNVAGASGNAGLTQLLGNAPDGYSMGTLIALTVSSWATGLGSTTVDDFKIVAVTQDSPSMLFVPRNSPFKTFRDFLDHAKANPGQLKVATSGYGTQDDITLKYLESLGYATTNVPFARPAERYSAPLGGHTDAIYEEPGDVAQLLAAKQLRPIVVFDDKRHPSFPDVETSREYDMDISDLPNFRTIVVHKDTPDEKVAVLRAAIDRALDTPQWQKFCTETYTCTRKYSPEEAEAHVRAFYETVKKRLGEMK